jgi:hypothetical protein
VTAPPVTGAVHAIFELLDFIARLAALVPNPRVKLTRFHVAALHQTVGTA